jgi:hypothetical protein
MSVEPIKTYNQQYYELHKKDRKVKHICDVCGGKYNTNSKYYHNKSNKHTTALKLKEKDAQLNELNNKLKTIKENINNI